MKKAVIVGILVLLVVGLVIPVYAESPYNRGEVIGGEISKQPTIKIMPKETLGRWRDKAPLIVGPRIIDPPVIDPDPPLKTDKVSLIINQRIIDPPVIDPDPPLKTDKVSLIGPPVPVGKPHIFIGPPVRTNPKGDELFRGPPVRIGGSKDNRLLQR